MTSSIKAPLQVAFVTLGCPKNEVDTDRMRAAVSASSYCVVEEVDSADVVVLNTCSFIADATTESIETVLALAEERAPGTLDRRLIVTGCMPSRYGDQLATELPEVDAFIPVAEENTLISVIESLTHEPASARAVEVLRSASGPSAYVQISDGCHRSCAYCTIPTIRGPYRSRPLPEIISEVSRLVELGAKEVILIGQDTTAYGRDLDDGNVLADVIDSVAAVHGVEWLRVMYAQPDGIDERLLDTMAGHENVCRYLDMPLQHASKSVLRQMHRSGDASTFLALIDRIREKMPDVVLRTTVIAGFPGETRADAAELQRFLEQARFDYVGVFPYSQEEGTVAGERDDQVALRTRRARAQRLRDLGDRIGWEKAADLVGRTLEVLVEGVDEDDGQVIGRWRGQAPEIDGIVLLDRGEAGQIVQAEVVDVLGYDLEAEVR